MVRAALTARSAGSGAVVCRTGQPGRVSKASAARNRAVVSAAGDHVNAFTRAGPKQNYSKTPCSKTRAPIPRATNHTRT